MTMQGEDIKVVRTDPATPDALALLEASWRYLASLFKPEQRFHLDLNGLRQPHVRFFAATRGGHAAGCAALAVFGDWAEVKSMFVVEAARGTGVAVALMERLEAEARALGCHTLRLETGSTLHRARAFYTRHGFRPRGPFASYVAIPTSVFMEKSIAAPEAVEP
jgi:putative acetyltransferase